MKYAGINLLRELTLCFGPSGCEDAVRSFIIDQIKGDCDSYTVDKVGNLIAVKNGKGEHHKKVMLCAHMDEIGFIVTAFEDSGLIRTRGCMWRRKTACRMF